MICTYKSLVAVSSWDPSYLLAKGAESGAVGGTAPAASHSPAEASCAANLPFFSFKDGH